MEKIFITFLASTKKISYSSLSKVIFFSSYLRFYSKDDRCTPNDNLVKPITNFLTCYQYVEEEILLSGLHFIVNLFVRKNTSCSQNRIVKFPKILFLHNKNFI